MAATQWQEEIFMKSKRFSWNRRETNNDNTESTCLLNTWCNATRNKMQQNAAKPSKCGSTHTDIQSNYSQRSVCSAAATINKNITVHCWMSTCHAAQRTANPSKQIHHNTFVLLTELWMIHWDGTHKPLKTISVTSSFIHNCSSSFSILREIDRSSLYSSHCASARSCERPRVPCEYDTNLPLVIRVCDTLMRTSDAQATSSGIVIANSEWDQPNV